MGFPLVIKFPNEGYDGDEADRQDNVRHTQMEYRRIKRIGKRLPFMRSHMPKVFHYDAKAGVIVMELIKGRKMKNSIENGCINRILRMAFRKIGLVLEDGWGDNIIICRYKPGGTTRRAVIVDFGY